MAEEKQTENLEPFISFLRRRQKTRLGDFEALTEEQAQTVVDEIIYGDVDDVEPLMRLLAILDGQQANSNTAIADTIHNLMLACYRRTEAHYAALDRYVEKAVRGSRAFVNNL